MTFSKSLSASAVLAAVLCASAAHADVTAEQVWQDWVDYYTQVGQTVTAGKTERQGDTLVVTDVKMAAETPEVKTDGTIAEVRLKELGNGSVEVTFSNEIPFKMTAAQPGKDTKTEMSFRFGQKDMKLVASGTPDKMDYALNAPEMTFSMDDVKAGGEAPPVKAQLRVTNSTGTYHMEKAAGRAMTYDMTSDKLDMVITGADPEGKGTFNMSGALNSLKGKGAMTLPEGADMKNLSVALGKGTVMSGDFTYGDGAYTFDGTGPDGDFKGESKVASGALTFSMSKDGISYGGDAGATSIKLTSPSLPFPIEGSMAQSGFKFAMPVMKSDTPAPAALSIKMIDLTISDAIWGLFDPNAKLPRDPATLVIDLSGSVKPLIDLFDPAQAEAAAKAAEGGTATSPFEVSDAKINELHLKAVGAELKGQGAFTFDNSATPPSPVGSVDLSLTGANKLMDNLVAAGLVPQDQVMGFRMMLGMFAVPNGEDSYTSKIERKADGSVLANGQRIQ